MDKIRNKFYEIKNKFENLELKKIDKTYRWESITKID